MPTTIILTPKEKEKISDLFNKYLVVAKLFNKFFGETRPVEKMKFYDKVLKSRNLYFVYGTKAWDRVSNLRNAWHKFKEHWYKFGDLNYENDPFGWFQYFLDDPERHLSEVLKYSSDSEKAWIYDCIKEDKFVENYKIFVDDLNKRIFALTVEKDNNYEPEDMSNLLTGGDEWE